MNGAHVDSSQSVQSTTKNVMVQGQNSIRKGSLVWSRTMSKNEPKADFLRECMSDPALVQKPLPIDQFCRMFCVVCGQKVCSRSRASTMIFTERVANWKTRLFDEVPRAADNDENYARIRAKNFQNIEAPISIGQRFQEPAPKIEQPMTEVQSEPIHQSIAPLEEKIPEPIIRNAAPQHVDTPIMNNTPFLGGITLPGKPVDDKTDKFIEPGATFVFDSDE